MKYITLIAMTSIVLLDIALQRVIGAVPQSSVAGTIALALAFIAAALAVGMHEAWSGKRGAVGWIVSVTVALLGALVGAGLSGIVLEPILNLLGVDESQADARHPLLWVASAGMMLHTLLGSWIALSIVKRWR